MSRNDPDAAKFSPRLQRKTDAAPLWLDGWQYLDAGR